MAVKNAAAKNWVITPSYDGNLYSAYPNGDKPIPSAWGSGGTDWYLSPSGSDANNGLSSGAPKKTFANVFAAMASGDQLYLMDGTYSVAAGTGVIHWDTATYDANSAQIPAGVSLARSTRVKAVNDGAAIVSAPLFIGRSNRADNYIEVWGCKFTGGGSLFNGSYNSLKNIAFDGVFGIGTSDHAMPVQYNLVEDCWIWATGERIIAINYQASKNTWRRVVVRGDGCGTVACTGSGNPNVGFSVYDSQECSVMNMIQVDRLLAASPNADYPYADFATAQHTPGEPDKYLGLNKWLGCMSIASEDNALNFEADDVIPAETTWTINNFVCVTAADGGVNVGATGPVVMNGITCVSAATSGDGIRVAPTSPGTSVTNTLVKNFNRGLNSAIQPSYTSTYGAPTLYNQTTPTVGVFTANPTADGTPASLKYPVRIESGSALKDAGLSGADIGATIMYCYGADGSRYGDADRDTLGTTALWPYPNEARIKADFATAANGARGFCTGNSIGGTAQSLTKYIWEQLGNEVPADYYAGWAA